MQLNPYLTFDGTCSAALEFYAEALGAQVPVLMRFGEMPEQPDWVTDANRDRVAHGQLHLPNGQVIMVSDSGGMEPFGGHSGFNLQLNIDDPEEGRTVYERLAEGGTREMDFGPTFWAKGFGTLRDRFGVPWMVNCE